MHTEETLCYGYGTVCTKFKKPHKTDERDENTPKCKWHECKLEACPQWPECNPWRDETLAFNILCVRCSGTGRDVLGPGEDPVTCPDCQGQMHGVQSKIIYYQSHNGRKYVTSARGVINRGMIHFGTNRKTFTNCESTKGRVHTSVTAKRTQTAVATVTVGEDYNGQDFQEMKIGVQGKTPEAGRATMICWYNSDGTTEGGKIRGWKGFSGAHDEPSPHGELKAGDKVTVVLVDEQIVFLYNGERVGRAWRLPFGRAYSEIELFVSLRDATVTLQTGEDQTQILQYVISTLPNRS